MSITACRGEYEPASLVITTEHLLKDVTVTVSPLAGDSGTLPPESVDVRIVQPYFFQIRDWPTTVPWLLVHDPNLFSIEDQPQPIAQELGADRRKRSFSKTKQLTREGVDTDTLQPVDVSDIKQFWITVHVPQDAQAGTYRATVSVMVGGAQETRLTLQVQVPSFDLLPPIFEYSIYYPVYLNRMLSAENPGRHNEVSEQQYLDDLKNMVAHGCTNPNIYDGPFISGDGGSLDFMLLETILQLREQAGIEKKSLYLVGHPLSFESSSADEMARITSLAREIVIWAKTRGYPDVYFMAQDERQEKD